MCTHRAATYTTLGCFLMVVKGVKCYADVRACNGVVYATFSEACSVRGLLDDDAEWYSAFDKALKRGVGGLLCQLLVTIVFHCHVNDEKLFFEKY